MLILPPDRTHYIIEYRLPLKSSNEGRICTFVSLNVDFLRRTHVESFPRLINLMSCNSNDDGEHAYKVCQINMASFERRGQKLYYFMRIAPGNVTHMHIWT